MSKRWKVGRNVLLILIAVTVAVFAAICVIPTTTASAKSPSSSTVTPKPKATKPVATVCGSGSYAMNMSPSYANGSWVSGGVQAIRDAKTDAQAAAAAGKWLDKVELSPYLIAGAEKTILKQDASPTTFVTNGCATPAAIQAVTNMRLQFTTAKSIVPSTAAANGYNSGTSSSGVVYDGTAGIGGDRTAIKIVLSDGSTFWIMARCGNIVTPGPSVATPPENVTTTVVPPTPNNTCPPGSVWNESGTICLESKVTANNVGAPAGTTQSGLGGDTDNTSTGGPSAGTDVSGSIGTSGSPGHTGAAGIGTGDHGSGLPAVGASPNPSSGGGSSSSGSGSGNGSGSSSTPSPAPTISQAPSPTDPGTPIPAPS